MEYGDVFYLAIIGLLIIVIIYLIFRSRKKTRFSKFEISPEYLQGLEALVDGNPDKALEKMKLAAVKNTGNIQAYIRIGEILRRADKINGAIKIHKQLTVRQYLSDEQKQKIYQALVVDYFVARDYESALTYAREIQKLEKNDPWALQKELECYERLLRWDEAFKLKQRILKNMGQNDDKVLALYKVQQGIALRKQNLPKESKNAFNDAKKIDNQCAPAYLHLARLFSQEEKQQDALNQLKELIEKAPEYAWLAFEGLKQILFEMGKFSEIETIFKTAHKKLPDNQNIALALAEIYEKKGNVEAAAELVHQILRKSPDFLPVLYFQLKTLVKSGHQHDAAQMTLDWLEKQLEKQRRFTCDNCHYQSDDPFWLCPQCGSWNSMKNN